MIYSKMSKKGQGLALVSILVLIAILYFVFRYNTDTYAFVMTAGDEQAHLVTAYTEGAKVKSFAQVAARQAAFETIWNISKKVADGSALSYCSDAGFQSQFKSLFDNYANMYTPTTAEIQTYLPDYNFSFTCPAAMGLKIEGVGYLESCTLLNSFPFPQYPCEDQNKSSCSLIKFTQPTNYNGGQACKLTADLNCTDSLPRPACDSQDSIGTCTITAADGMRYCWWQKSYSEPISIISAPLVNYQFSIDSDAHFIESINGTEYQKFAKARVKAFPPSCSISMPGEMFNGLAFNISIIYVDDGAPNAVDFTITHSKVQDAIANLTSGLSEFDSSDKVYSDGKAYYYAANLVNGTYNAEVTCIDGDDNKVTTQKDFTVSKV